MAHKTKITRLAELLNLTPYQAYILDKNCKKYDLSGLVKRGNVLYAPYLCDDKNNLYEYLCRLFAGPRADLIGTDKMLVKDQRGIRVYASGFYSAYYDGSKYYADPMGNHIERSMFVRMT